MKLTQLEQRAAISIAGIYGLRMLGLFLVMPVLVIYASELKDYNLVLAGLAVGVYGLGQALFQVPLGYLSDKVGRKPIIIGGLLVFAFGSLIAAQSDTMVGLIIGRAIQGAGAIASTLMAFISDLSRPQVRSKLMAAIGVTIGISFVVSMVLGPWLTIYINVDGIFYLTSILALIAIAVVIWLVPAEQPHQDTTQVLPVKAQLNAVFHDTQLQMMNISIFTLHMSLTAVFVVIPTRMLNLGLALEQHAWVYMVLMSISFLFMIPLLIWTEKRQQHRSSVLLCIALILIAMMSLSLSLPLLGLWFAMGLFFIAFNFLEASIPAMLSRLCGAKQRGTAMGFYSSSQFFGAFAGGLVAGLLTQYFSSNAVFVFIGGATLIWFVVTLNWLKPIAKDAQ